MFTEPLEEALLEEEPAWTAVPSYSECKNGSSRIGVAIRNVSRKVIVIAKGQQVAQVSAANQVPNMYSTKVQGGPFLRETKGFPTIWRVTAAYQLTPY